MEDQKSNVGRREFAKTLAGAAALSAAVPRSRATVHPNPPGIKIATSAPANPTDEDLLFFQQTGVEYVSLPASPQSNAESFTKMRERYESAGIKVYNIGSGVGPSGSLHNMPEVTLNLPGRDQKIAEYKQYSALPRPGGHPLHDLCPHGQRHLEQRTGDHTRAHRAASWICRAPTAAGTGPERSMRSLSPTARVFTKEEIWENYTYFIKQVAPVAEEAGVRIGIHPDDPPAPDAGRCAALYLRQFRRLQARDGNRQ